MPKIQPSLKLIEMYRPHAYGSLKTLILDSCCSHMHACVRNIRGTCLANDSSVDRNIGKDEATNLCVLM